MFGKRNRAGRTDEPEKRERHFWRGSLQWKFALSYIAIVGAVLVLLNTYPILTSQELVFKAKQTSLQNQASVMASTLAALEVLTQEDVVHVMDMLDDSGLNRVLVTGTTGLTLYDTQKETGKYALLQEIVLCLEGNDVFYSRYDDGAFRSSAAIPVTYRNAVIGAVYVYEYDAEQGALLTGLQRNLRNISLVVCVLALVLSYFLSRTLTRRISRLHTGIRSLSRQEPGAVRVEVRGRDELADLAEEFNRMAEQLQATNDVRRRFVSDASHELKTPLASIRLLIDSILQNEGMDRETELEFVADIGSETERLSRITENLLTLTRLDNQVEPQPERVDVGQVVADALHMLTPLADQREVAFQLALEPDCYVRATADGVYQIVFNLVENAIKYNRQGGQVFLALNRAGEKITLLVEDTGVGVPEEERDKVFLRFYRVDKARSREAGGTGLGLSIVRDTVLAFGGDIHLESREGGGSRFVTTLPAAREVQP